MGALLARIARGLRRLADGFDPEIFLIGFVGGAIAAAAAITQAAILSTFPGR